MQKSVLGLALLAFSLAAQPPALSAPAKAPQEIKTAGFSFAVGAAPAWVVPVAEVSAAALPKSPLHYVMLDEQIRIEGESSTAYTHVIRQINDSAGLGPAAQIEIGFDPSYQTLTLHKIEVVRAGKRIDRLDRRKIQLLQRETRLEARMYDGRVTASVVLDDVRVGDRIEYSYSVRGSNPVFGGKAVEQEWLGSRKGPSAVAQFRLLAPENRIFATRAGAGIVTTSTVQGGWRDTRFRRVAAPQLEAEEQMPASAILDDMVVFSEFADWTAVRDWGTKLFAPPPVSPAVQQRAAAIRAQAQTPEQRLLLALTLVQKDIRYFGVEIGASSHRPAAPDAVLERRSGDCKDKTVLLVALLKALDIKATPVLVSTDFENDIGALLPSPAMFDHVIARVELDGKVYWLDGTRSQQTGPLEQRQSVGLGKGLVLDASVPPLTDLPGTANEERVAVSDVFHVASMAQPPELESRVTYQGEMAEMIRAAIAVMTQEKFESQSSANYLRIYPGLRSVAPLRIEEQEGRNALTIVQRFAVPDFWRFPEQRALVGEIGLWNLAANVQVPNTPERKHPFRLQLPGIYRHSVTIEFPEAVYRVTESKRASEHDAYVTLQTLSETTPNRARVSGELRILKDQIPPADWRSFNGTLAKMRPRMSSAITVPPMSPAAMDKMSAQLKTLLDDMRKGVRVDARVVTPAQAQARVRQAVLTADLESGFLNPRLRAQALIQRAIQRDHLGKPEAALADYDEALRLTPDDQEALAAAAVNAFLRGDHARARELGQRVLQRAPADTDIHGTLGLTEYASGDYQAAIGHWKAWLADDTSQVRGYPALWLYLSNRHAGQDGVAAVQPYLQSLSTTDWPNQVVQWFAGTGSYEQALKAARDNTDDPSHLCELYFYAGEKALLDGDKAKAREYYRKSIGTGVVEFNEYLLAQQALDSLGN
jgi:lipoprotein NlpI/transglutaminase-like putative cysteine protease